VNRVNFVSGGKLRWAAAGAALVLFLQSGAVAQSGSTTSTTATTAAPVATTSTTISAEQQRINSRLTSLRADVAEASTEEAALLGKLDDLSTRRRSFDSQIAVLDGQLAPVQRDLDAAQARLDVFEAAQLEAEQRLNEAQSLQFAAQEILQRRAIIAYTQQPASRYVAWLLGVKDIREAQTVGVYLGVALRAQSQAVRQYQKARKEVQERRDELDKTRSEAAAQRNVVATERNRLAGQRGSQVALRQQASALIGQQSSLLDELRRRKREFESQIADLQRQSSSLASSLRARQAGQIPGPSGHGVLAVPIPGAPVTSSFGKRVHPIYGDVRQHDGIDFGASSGTPIHAAADGVVVSSGTLGGYGTATVIDHGNTLATVYGHQSATLVAAGQKVTKNQVIGRVGSTGMSTGPHLHFEVRKNGTPVDPMPYL
jgi:murein DD-endopeptidase MepM/ murein hydrolase activator NlpD